jgi:hypothetical protein
MSVIINNMAMPETCYECRFHETSYWGRAFCVAHLNYIEDPRSGRLDTCPIEEVPTNDVSDRKDDAWNMFELITSVYYGKQYYFLQDDGLVYSRKSHKCMTEDAAIDEFLDAISERKERRMGVYIRNIDIPEIKRGAAAIINIDDILFFKTADDILLVPDHGDLADKDAMQKEMIDLYDKRSEDAYMTGSKGALVDWDDAVVIVKNEPVVIPAERSIDKDKDVLCKSAEKSEEECEEENWYTELDDPKIAERSEE